MQRALRNAGNDINFFEQSQFAEFQAVLDGELKQLNATGKFVHKKKASVNIKEMENILWEKGLLADHSLQVLSDSMVYLIGFCIALRSREEHRRLRFIPAQIQLVELPLPGSTKYLVYKLILQYLNSITVLNRNISEISSVREFRKVTVETISK